MCIRDRNLFSRLYIGCQNRDGNLEEVFKHENHACPPALSDGGGIRQGAKSDLLACLEDVSQPRSKAPATSCIVLDGGSDRSDAKTSHSQKFQRVRTGGLHALHPVEVSANYATRPGVGPLPARLPLGLFVPLMGQKTSGGRCIHSWQLGQIPQSR